MSSEVKICWLPSTTDGLRFVEQNGKFILQQAWIGYRFGIAMESEWRNVPLEVINVREEATD